MVQAALTSDGLYLVTLTQQVLLSPSLSSLASSGAHSLSPVHTVCVAAVCAGSGGYMGGEGEDGEGVLPLQP